MIALLFLGATASLYVWYRLAMFMLKRGRQLKEKKGKFLTG